MKKVLYTVAALLASSCMVLGMANNARAEKPLTLRLGHPMAPGNNVTVGTQTPSFSPTNWKKKTS